MPVGPAFRAAAVAIALAFTAIGAAVPAQAQQSNSKRAVALYKAGKYKAALAVTEKLVREARARGGENSRLFASAINLKAIILKARGRFDEAEPLYKRALAIRTRLLGKTHVTVALSMTSLAALYKEQGRYGVAEPLFKNSLAILKKRQGSNHPNVGSALNNLAELYRSQGRLADALAFHKSALALRERARGPQHPETANSLNNLANTYFSLGRYSLAVPLHKRALAIKERRLGRKHPSVGISLNNLASIYVRQEKYRQAEPLFERATGIWRKALGEKHPNVAASLNNIAKVKLARGDYDRAGPLLARAQSIWERSFGPRHPNIASALTNLAELRVAQGRLDDAAPLHNRALLMRNDLLGPEHPRTADSYTYLGLLDIKRRQWSAAYASFTRAAAIRRVRAAGQPDLTAPLNAGPTRSLYRHLAEAAWRVGQDDFEREKEMAGAAFEAAQNAQKTRTSRALAQMAARFSTGNGQLAKSIRSRQDAITRWQRLDQQLVHALSRLQRNNTRIAKLRSALSSATDHIKALNATLERNFPRFAELSDPRPLMIDAAQKLLQDDEALLVILIARTESFIWAITGTQVEWRRIPLGAEPIAAIVASLRRGLEPGAARGLERVNDGDKSAAFNLQTAHALYQALLSPVQNVIAQKKRLIYVPSGALTALPLHVLVTKKPTSALPAPKEYAQAAWLAKSHAITVLPSVSSLRALRAFARGKIAPEPFIGYGDPVFGRNKQGTSRGVRGYSGYFREGLADLEKLSLGLPRLADTADELRDVARALDAPEAQVVLRGRATEAHVKQTDLTRYRVVHFATHGLVAGEIAGLAEPALALSLPKKASRLDDGLLTASEVAKLKLNANWVILSACNTAAGDRPGAEALSGLARAFIYAGARTLLVSHWPVVSQAAVKLTTALFNARQTDPGLSNAAALQHAMVKLIQDPSSNMNGYPATWAPFVVVGEDR